MAGGSIPIITDAFELVGRMAGRAVGNSGPGYEGQFGSPGFFAAAHVGDERALRTMEKKGYGLTWKLGPKWQTAVEKEILKDKARFEIGRAHV